MPQTQTARPQSSARSQSPVSPQGTQKTAKGETTAMRPIRQMGKAYYFTDGGKEIARVKKLTTAYVRGNGDKPPTTNDVTVGLAASHIAEGVRSEVTAYLVGYIPLPLDQDPECKGNRLWPVTLFVPA